MESDVVYVPKVCAYVTRLSGADRGPELLVFESPEHGGLQVPKGTIEPGETPREALRREVEEEAGIPTLDAVRHLTTDVWTRRRSPPRRYRRHFFHANVEEDRDAWTHEVTGSGSETGLEFEFYWLELPTSKRFALSLDDYVDLLVQTPDVR
ncbi:NUDIX hydrolase [Halosolutus gelatinilyticus]|uniref:NUDIX hydrolase n=1 Tax=Halosolutus gelatinilyticus TaxID=2931975 RepID=UPI001FF37488|nr:NUDIX domain-containing protein [Halosolutus gelatinilyticus]